MDGAALKYAAGQKVYGTGSSAPTTGTVDPTGYIDRELNKSTTGAPSQARSGLAQAALAKLKGNPIGDYQVTQPGPSSPAAAPITGFVINEIGQLVPQSPTPPPIDPTDAGGMMPQGGPPSSPLLALAALAKLRGGAGGITPGN